MVRGVEAIEARRAAAGLDVERTASTSNSDKEEPRSVGVEDIA